MKSKFNIRVCCLFSIFLATAISTAQEAALQEEQTEERERIIVNMETLEASSIAEAVTLLSGSDSDLRVFPETGGNRLVVDGPKADMPAIVGLIRELDRPFSQVTVGVTEVAIELGTKEDLKSGPSEDAKKQLDELVKSGKAKIINKMTLEVGNNTSGRTSIGASKPGMAGGSGKAKAYNYKDVGTILECTPRVGADAVLLQFTYERSDIKARTGDEETPPTFTSMRSETFIRVRTNQSVVMSGMRPGDDGESKMVAWKLIVSADVSKD